MKGFLAADAISFLAVLAHPGSDATQDRPGESHLAEAPLLQSTIASQPCVPLRPVLPTVAPMAANSGVERVLELPTPAAAGGRSILISAQVRGKYRRFRESLTSP